MHEDGEAVSCLARVRPLVLTNSSNEMPAFVPVGSIDRRLWLERPNVLHLEIEIEERERKNEQVEDLKSPYFS